jgi:hypothetical protein
VWLDGLTFDAYILQRTNANVNPGLNPDECSIKFLVPIDGLSNCIDYN